MKDMYDCPFKEECSLKTANNKCKATKNDRCPYLTEEADYFE